MWVCSRCSRRFQTYDDYRAHEEYCDRDDPDERVDPRVVADGGAIQERRTVADVIDQDHVYRLPNRTSSSDLIVHVDEDCDGFNRADREPTQKPADVYPVGSVELCTLCIGIEEVDQ